MEWRRARLILQQAVLWVGRQAANVALAGAEAGSGAGLTAQNLRIHLCTSLLLMVILEVVVFDLTPYTTRVRERGLQVRHSEPSARMVQREKEKHRMDGWSPVFPPESCLSSCRWPLGSKAHHSTRAGCIPQQPSCGHPSLSSDNLDTPPRLQALCSWLPASFYKWYAVSFTSLYTCLLHKIVNMHIY